MSDKQAPIETPFAQKVEDFKHRRLPLIVWAACAAFVAYLMIGRGQSFEYIGVAHAPVYEVSVQKPGTVESLVVDLYDYVEPGDVVAKLSDAALLASIETANATSRQLTAELEAARAGLLSDQGDRVADLRRFQVNEETRRLEMLSLRVVIESDEIEAERRGLEVQRNRPLVDAGVMSEMAFEEIRLQQAEVLKRLTENKILLRQLEQEYEAARDRRIAFEEQFPVDPGHEPILQPLREAINVTRKQIDEIEEQRLALTLRSPVSGQVSQILCRRGQSVVPGEPILLIAERSVKEIVAYLGENDGARITADTRVLISSKTRPGPTGESVVLRVGPTVETLPQRLWRDPAIPDYGRAVIIATGPRMQLMPGELVDVRFLID